MANGKRLIDANELAAHKFPFTYVRYHVGWNDAISDIMENAPTVDAMEVVRCKDCKNWDTNCCSEGQGWCPLVVGYRPGDWFCASGERKTITDQTMRALEAMDRKAHGGER